MATASTLDGDALTLDQLYSLTPDSGTWYWEQYNTTGAYSQVSSRHSMEDVMASHLPSDVYTAFDDAGALVSLLESGFSSGTPPSWFADMPEEAQTYMQTQYLIADPKIDWGGTALETLKALIPTTASGGSSTTAAGNAVFAISEEASFMSVLSDALPTSINNLRNDAAYTNGPFANAIYDDFTSGTPPPWFTAMPNAVQSFLILDYIPNWMSERPMALRVLGETAQPGASPTSSIPTSTLTPIQTSLSTAMDPELFSDTAPEPSDRHLVPIVVGTIVSVVVLAALLALILLLMRRKRRQRDEAHYPKAEVQDTKRPARRFSDTTFISNNNGSSRYYSSQHIGQQRPLPEISISPEPSRLEHGHSRSESAAISAVGGTEADGSGRSEGAGGERSELEAPRSTSPGMASSFRSELAAGGDEEAGRPSMERHY